MKVNILGVKIDDVSLNQAVEFVSGWIQEGGKHYIVTPNPEFIVAAYSEEDFKKILNKADLAIPDGAGLKLTGRIKNTTTGIDLMEALCQEASEKGWKVGLIGGRDGVAAKAAEVLKKRYSDLKITYAIEDPQIPENSEDPSSDPSGTQSPSESFRKQTDLLFVALGMGKQERWIVESMRKVDSYVFMGVGGAFDYISGNVKRAPIWMRKLGLEWLFRLIVQPWRIKRQVNLLKFISILIIDFVSG